MSDIVANWQHWQNWPYWRDWLTWLYWLSTAVVIWLLPLALLVLLVVLAARHQLNPRPAAQAGRPLGPEADTEQRRQAMTGARRWMILGEGLNVALRWRLARVQKLIGGLTGRLVAAELAIVELAPALNELRSSALGLGAATAVLSPEMAGKLYVGLYLGDCAVAAGILMANNTQLPLVLAIITSLAIATSQFAVGKLLGKALTERGDDRVRLMGPLVVLVLLGVSLAALLHHIAWAWIFLSVTPAIGAAALTVASHDPPRQRFQRAKSRMRGPRRRYQRALTRLGRSVGRASAAWTQAAALTARGILAPEMAQAAAADVIVVGAALTENVRGIESMLNDVQALRLPGGFDDIVARLAALLDQVAEVTAAHVGAYQWVQVPEAAALHPSGVAKALNGSRPKADVP